MEIKFLDSSQATTKISNNNHSFNCDYCKKEINGLRYRCLECHEYDLCNYCFLKRKSNNSHETGHKIIQFGSTEYIDIYKDFEDHEIYLDNLKEKFKNEIHQNIKCNICNCDPIKGLRFKCDSCNGFNLCENCCDKSFQKHLKNHPLITYCKTVSYEIKNLSDIKILEELRRGAFGKINKAKYDNKIVSCKTIEARKTSGIFTSSSNDNYDELRKSYLRELNSYNEIKGDNILRMIGFCTVNVSNGHNIIILSEYMTKGSLENLIKNEPYLEDKIRFDISAGIARGMAQIHRLGIIHCDIRPGNIMITDDYVPKIGDMGIARIIDENSQKTLIGSIVARYMPPEYYASIYTNKLDVFSFGLTLNEIFLGNHTSYNKRIKITKEANLIYSSLIFKLVNNDPIIRPSSQEIEKKFSFLQNFINEKINDKHKTFKYIYYDAIEQYEIEKENKSELKILEYLNKKLEFEEIYNNSNKDSKIPSILEIISYMYFKSKQSEKALEFANKSLQKTIELFKDENCHELMKAYARLGFIHLKSIKDFNQANQYYLNALESSINLYGKQHPYTANYYFRIGECFFENSDIEQALEYFLKSLEIRRNIYDSNSEYIFYALSNIRNCYSKLNDTKNFFKFRDEEIAIKRDLFKTKNPDKEYKDLLLIRGKDKGMPAWHYIEVDNEKHMSLTQQKKGSNIDVADYGTILESGWGEEPPCYLKNNLEEYYSIVYPHFKCFKINGISIDDLLNDDDYFEDTILKSHYFSLKVNFEFHNGENNFEFVEDLYKISDRYYELNDSYNCILYAEKCIEICKRFPNDQRFKYFNCQALRILGCCYTFILKDKQALHYFEQEFVLRRELVANDHPQIASLYYLIGKAYFQQEKLNEALENFFKCLEIRKIIYTNQTNQFNLYVLDSIKDCYNNLNDTENFLKYRKEALKIKKDYRRNK